MAHRCGLSHLDAAAFNARDAYLAYVIIVVEIAYQRLQAAAFLSLGTGDILEHGVEQRIHVVAVFVRA